jgi:hypothetical protein
LVREAWDISSAIGPCFPLAEGLCNKFYANTGGKRPIQRQPLLVQYKQQANPHLSLHNYTPLVISGNDKNKQLTFNNNVHIMTRINHGKMHFLRHKINGAPKIFYKTGPSFN